MEFLTIIVLMKVITGTPGFKWLFFLHIPPKNIISNGKKAFKPVLQPVGVLVIDAIQSFQKNCRGKIIEDLKSPKAKGAGCY